MSNNLTDEGVSTGSKELLERDRSSSSQQMEPSSSTNILDTITTDSSSVVVLETSIILFYKYHPLSSDRSLVEIYRTALESLCRSLHLKGRILVGCNQHRSEGINGTLSGNKDSLDRFVTALTKNGQDTREREKERETHHNNKAKDDPILQTFRNECHYFYQMAGCPPLVMDESEFKWSTHTAVSTANNNNNNQNDNDPSVSSMNHSESAEQRNGSDAVSADSTTSTSTFSSPNDPDLFPDLNIKIVTELIGTGGVMAQIPLDELHQGYLTPHEWHERVKAYNTSKQRHASSDGQPSNLDTILIDCRNTKECQIGHFEGAIDPHTTTFNQFTTWVQNHQQSLHNKKVLMYCTGGIRCEKASAYIRRTVPTVQEVRHLKGGIHKYLEEYGGNVMEKEPSMWKGKNFVFDGRGAHGPPTPTKNLKNGDTNDSSQSSTLLAHGTTKNEVQTTNDNAEIVGSCRYCAAPYDTFDPHCVCTVCREPTLVCKVCQESDQYREYHCKTHQHLQDCYFTNLEPFTTKELESQMKQLRMLMAEIAVGKKYRARRKTLSKQCDKIQEHLQTISSAENDEDDENIKMRPDKEWKCRNCGSTGCSGKCWGFHSLKRKRILEDQRQLQHGEEASLSGLTGHDEQRELNKLGPNFPAANPTTRPLKKKSSEQSEQAALRKDLLKQEETEGWIRLGLVQPPWIGRNNNTGIRVPSPCIRVLNTTTKAKWCGQPLFRMLQTEFVDMKDSTRLSILLENGLIRVNEKSIRSLEEAETQLLKNMDVISRIVHWHEPPIYLPTERIQVNKTLLPTEVICHKSLSHSEEKEFAVYICNKPSTVPVHPAGPYLSNSLTIMVEAQEGLSPKSLIPCHRIDRVTSGLTICCTDPQVARLVQSTIEQGKVGGLVQKEYLAKVHGQFPASAEDPAWNLPPSAEEWSRWKWRLDEQDTDNSNNTPTKNILQVDAPIETVDPANGIRKITPTGKEATSLFRLLNYDSETDTSILSCTPVTGRSHQLRVHLQYLGYPIVNDVQYGGSCEADNKTFDSDALMEFYRRTEQKQALPVTNSDAISVIDHESARKACQCCSDGPSAAFTEAQLLQRGHAICLHALRYQMKFKPPSSKSDHKKNASSDPKTLDSEVEARPDQPPCQVEFSVDFPPWASRLNHNSCGPL
ncbi:rhodanese-like domain containing protein [Nitzschia inconspicua]|uniref:Rhodanese-like domain containing protein n=1 Tax=Nitzschia inconspicua TaxID=303405 RepID=A0A9K3LKA7_9STRA|nr:rhodanese-like domain containing protein [Nitzschia inconspicua]